MSSFDMVDNYGPMTGSFEDTEKELAKAARLTVLRHSKTEEEFHTFVEMLGLRNDL